MEFWRHTWSIDDWEAYPTILTNFKNFGFVRAFDGSEIDDYNDFQEIASPYQSSYPVSATKIKWRYDTEASNTSNFLLISKSPSGTNTTNRWDNKGKFIAFNSTGTYYSFMNSRNDSGDTAYNGQPCKTFFIPLKDNGFFFNARVNAEAGHWQGSAPEYTDPDGYHNFGQTPTLVTTGTSYLRTDVALDNTQVANLICLPTSKINDTNSFIYIFFSKVPSSAGYSYAIINNGRGTSYTLNFHETPNQAYSTHTDINQNVCTLVKYPWEGGMLDNLYIMTTAPSNIGDDVAFFSISNRNFMKVFENIVVELPSN